MGRTETWCPSLALRPIFMSTTTSSSLRAQRCNLGTDGPSARRAASALQRLDYTSRIRKTRRMPEIASPRLWAMGSHENDALLVPAAFAAHRSALLRPHPRKKGTWGDTPHAPRQLLHFPSAMLRTGPSTCSGHAPAGALDGTGVILLGIFIGSWCPPGACVPRNDPGALLAAETSDSHEISYFMSTTEEAPGLSSNGSSPEP
jgi:hypothetical protein